MEEDSNYTTFMSSFVIYTRLVMFIYCKSPEFILGAFFVGEIMHEKFMNRALELAQKGFVSPNPRVGAVLVKDGNIIAEGYHKKFGGNHAEIELFNTLSEDFDYTDTVLYVSLEPCSHYGKTPPCAKKIIELGIKNVCVACLDPNPLVAGKGVQMLEEAGVDVVVGILENKAKIINEAFFKFISTKRPFVLLKSAMSLDGKICTNTGESKWISSEESREEVHFLRSQMSAIMVGINTVLVDNPMLNSRIENGRDPVRIVIDSSLRTPIDSNVVQTAKEIPTIIATTTQDKHKPYIDKGVEVMCVPKNKDGRVDLYKLMEILATKNIDSILVEGGAELAYSALESGIVDKVQLYYAPIIIGGKKSKSFIGGKGVDCLEDVFRLKSYSVRSIGKDFVVEGYTN